MAGASNVSSSAAIFRKPGNRIKTMYIIAPDLYRSLLDNFKRRQELLSSPAINSMLDLETKMNSLLENSPYISQEQKVEKYSQLLREFLRAQEQRWKEEELKACASAIGGLTIATAPAAQDSSALQQGILQHPPPPPPLMFPAAMALPAPSAAPSPCALSRTSAEPSPILPIVH